MVSRYVVQIADEDTGEVVSAWPPQKSERYGVFIDALCARVDAKGVGTLKTAAHVIAALRDAWHESIAELKREV